MQRTEPEWRVEDVALLEAFLDAERDRGQYGQSMTEALDSDTSLGNPAGTHIYEPYALGPDNAELAVEAARRKWVETHGGDESSLHGLIWGVHKIPRPAPIKY